MSESILIADDSLLVRESVESALRARGSRVALACDGAEARARLRDAEPDLLIADVHMPGLDGYSLCREAKSERPHTRVLLLVGTFEPFDSGAATSARADGVLRKPFLNDELLRKVEDLLGPVPAPAPPRREIEAAAPADATAADGATAEDSFDDAPAAAESAAASASPHPLSDADVDRIARRVLELGGEAVLERVARELLGEAVLERVRRSAAEGGAAWHGRDDRGGDPERE